MSQVTVANVHLESTGNNRITYQGSNTVSLFAGGVQGITANSSTVYIEDLSANNLTLGGATLTVDNTFRLDTENQVIAGGATVTIKDLGSITSGTVTPDPGDRPLQKYTNNGAHTFDPSTNHGSYNLTIVNGGSAGAITTSNFDKVTGDSFTTTPSDIFLCSVVITDVFSLLQVQAI